MAQKYEVVEYDKDYDTKRQVVSDDLTKDEAETQAKFLNFHADPLASVRYEVRKEGR